MLKCTARCDRACLLFIFCEIFAVIFSLPYFIFIFFHNFFQSVSYCLFSNIWHTKVLIKKNNVFRVSVIFNKISMITSHMCVPILFVHQFIKEVISFNFCSQFSIFMFYGLCVWRSCFSLCLFQQHYWLTVHVFSGIYIQKYICYFSVIFMNRKQFPHTLKKP